MCDLKNFILSSGSVHLGLIFLFSEFYSLFLVLCFVPFYVLRDIRTQELVAELMLVHNLSQYDPGKNI